MRPFRCERCGEEHSGVPAFAFKFPIEYLDVPELEREERVFLTDDVCVIDDALFFVRGNLEIPIRGSDETLVWGVWVRVGEEDFFRFQELLGVDLRSHHGPFAGRLSSPPRPYPDSTGLKALVRIRDHGLRPGVEIEDAEHPLGTEQQEGITGRRLAEIIALMVHGTPR